MISALFVFIAERYVAAESEVPSTYGDEGFLLLGKVRLYASRSDTFHRFCTRKLMRC